MSKTEGILKDALEKLNDKDATNKSVAPGAVETKPDTSNTQGSVESEATSSNTTGIGESEKSATDEESETDKSNEEAKDTTEDKSAEATNEADKSADKDEKLQQGMKADTKLDDSGKVSDGDDDDDDDDKSALAGILKSVGFEDLSKSIKSQADVIKSSQDRVDETLKSLPDRLAEALSKSLDTYFEKNVITARNTTDLTQSEKDIDGSQDQSQKCDKVKKDDDDDGVEESAKKDKISTSEKSAEGKDETEKSFVGEGRAAQASDESDTVNKSMDSQEEAPKSYSPTEIVSKAVDLENKVADKKFTAKGRDWDKLDDIYKTTKSAREHLNSDALKSALDKFEDFIK